MPLVVAVAEYGFRFTESVYANLSDLLTGKGSFKAGARWNAKGAFPALYFALDPETALAEVLAHRRYQNIPDAEATPLTLFSCHIRLEQILNMTDPRIRRLLGISVREMSEAWLPVQQAREEALTQAVGRLAHEQGFKGLLVPSVPRHGGRNLVLFPRRLVGHELTVIHEEQFPAVRRRRPRRK